MDRTTLIHLLTEIADQLDSIGNASADMRGIVALVENDIYDMSTIDELAQDIIVAIVGDGISFPPHM